MLDDGANIVVPYLAEPDWAGIVYLVTHNDSGLLGRSVSMLSFVLTGMQFGLDPWGYKFHNLLIHLLNGVLLFRLLLVLLPLLDRYLDRNRVVLIAGITAVLWLLHPLLVSTVMYAVQRMTQLAVLFTLLALLCYLQVRTHPQNGWGRYIVFGWLLFPLCTLLAALSKEIGALIPVYILAIELLIYRAGIREPGRNRQMNWFLVTFVLLPVLLGTLVLILRFDALANYNGRTFTLQERLLTQVHVLFFYVRLILLPRISEMSLFHDDYPVTSGFDAATGALLVLLLVGLAAVWRLGKTLPVVAFGILLFLVSHLMESTVFPLEMVFEHRNYLASAGLLLLPIYLIFKWTQFDSLRFLCPLFIAIFAFMTATRATEWGDSNVFHQMSVLEHPTSGRALNNYVNILVENGDFETAITQLEKQIDLTPTQAGAYLHMQVLKCYVGMRDEAAMTQAVKLFGEEPVSVYGLNALQKLTVLVVDGDCPHVTLEEMEKLVDAALAFHLNNAYPYNEGYLLRARGIIAFGQGYYAQGFAFFNLAFEKSQDVEMLVELMKYQLDLGRLGDAEETLRSIEQQNAERFGIEQHKVNQASAQLEIALQKQAGTSND